MTKKKILLLFFAVVLIVVFGFFVSKNKTKKSTQSTDAPVAKQPVSSNEVIMEFIVNEKNQISRDIENALNSAYSDYSSKGGSITDYFSDYTDNFEIDFGSISNVNSFVNDSLYESVDFFDVNGELIETKENLPEITYNKRKVEVSENTLDLKNGSYYLVRYFDNTSIYTPYFIVFLYDNQFSVGDIWVFSSNETFSNAGFSDIEIENEF